MSRRFVRAAAVAGAAVELPLRPPPPAPPDPGAAMRDAGDEAAAMIAAARAEAEALREAARREGREEGLAAAREELAAAVRSAAEAAAALDARAAALEEAAVREAAALAVEVAARILRAEVAARPERVEAVARGAVRRAADRSRLVLRVHPGDLAACRAAAPAIVEEMGGIARLEVVDDPRVTRGSCVLETPGGDVDATFESQLARVLEAMAAPPDEELVTAS